MDDPAAGRRPGQEPGDGDSPPDGHARGVLGDGRDGPLHHGPPPRNHVEALVAVAPASGDEVRDAPKDVVLKGAVSLEAGRHLRQLTCHYLVEAGQEGMKQAELIHPPPIPVLPGRLRIPRGRVSVALDTRHLVPVAGQQHGQPHTDHPAADHRHSRHLIALPFSVPRG